MLTSTFYTSEIKHYLDLQTSFLLTSICVMKFQSGVIKGWALIQELGSRSAYSINVGGERLLERAFIWGLPDQGLAWEDLKYVMKKIHYCKPSIGIAEDKFYHVSI